MSPAGWRRGRGSAAALLAFAGLACTGPALRPGAPPAVESLADAPEAASGWSAKPGWHFELQAVAAAHPLAAQAGAAILRDGGSALDAAIATQMVLGLVEPQSSGIGGGAFLLHWDGHRVQAFDGRETAPAAADAHLFDSPDGRPLPLAEAVAGGRSVGVPGVLRMLEAAHRQHGRLPWPALFAPAIALAEDGFAVGPRLHALLRSDPHLRADPLAAALFYSTDRSAIPAGTRLRNPDYAAVLRDVAQHGAAAFYESALAGRIAEAVQRHARHPGRLSTADLAGYRERERNSLCHDWRRYTVCGFPPPSSGAIAIGQILGLLERSGTAAAPLAGGLPSAPLLHAYAEASKLAYADRAQHIGDPDFVAAPGGGWDSLLSADYLDARARLVGGRAMRRAAPGWPGSARSGAAGADSAREIPATSHLSIVDARGRAVSMTSTIEAQFGSRLMVNSGRGLAGGFLLNNQLTDFDVAPRRDGAASANRLQPGKRPRSSMSPTLVFERDGMRLVLVTGSPGGPPIIHYTAKTLLATLGWGLDAQAAVDLPNFGSLDGPMLLEAGRFPSSTMAALRERGHELREVALPSGAHTLLRTATGWSGGADPRREGSVAGD